MGIIDKTLTATIFDLLKKMGIKPKIGVATDVTRLPDIKNSFNLDLSKFGEKADPEKLKKLVETDSLFLSKASDDELMQFRNNLEYLNATYPDMFSKAEKATNTKTGIDSLVDDVNAQLSGKKAFKESVNPKTGEVRDVTNPVSIAEPRKPIEFNSRSEFDKLSKKHDKDIINAADEIGASLDDPKMGAQQIAETYAEMKLGKDYYDLSQKEQLDIYSKAYNYLTDIGGLRRQYNAVTKHNAGEELGMFDQKMIDKIKDTKQKETLENFDIKDREPNATGGRVGYKLGTKISYNKMFSDLDKTLSKGIGTMFKGKK